MTVHLTHAQSVSFVLSPAVLLWRCCNIKVKLWRPAMIGLARARCHHPARVRAVHMGYTHCHSGGVIAAGLIKSLFRHKQTKLRSLLWHISQLGVITMQLQ